MRAGWVTHLVDDRGDVVEQLKVAGGQHVFGPVDNGGSPNRLEGLRVDYELPEMEGLFLRDRYSRDPGMGEWYVPVVAPARLDVAATRTLQGVDLTRLLSRAGLRREEVLEVGQFVDEKVLDLLARYVPVHAHRFTVVDIDATLRAQLVMGVGDDLLKLTNAPLEAGGMTTWMPQPGGWVESTPWLPPEERGDVRGFSDDTSPTVVPFLRGWDVDDDAAAPRVNEVLVRCRGDAGLIVGRYADEASIARHGPIVDVTDGEATSQATADLLARRRWESLRNRRSIRFRGAWTPMRQGQVAPVEWSRWGIRSRFELVSKTVPRTLAAVTEYEMAEV